MRKVYLVLFSAEIDGYRSLGDERVREEGFEAIVENAEIEI